MAANRRSRLRAEQLACRKGSRRGASLTAGTRGSIGRPPQKRFAVLTDGSRRADTRKYVIFLRGGKVQQLP